MNETQPTNYWAIVELMGHVKTGGLISKDTELGTPLLRLDVPTEDGTVTQYINPSSLYRITMCEEEIARIAARGGQQAPIHRWQLIEALGPEFREALAIVENRKRQIELEFGGEFGEAETEEERPERPPYPEEDEDIPL